MKFVTDTHDQLAGLDPGKVINALRAAFGALAAGRALQPPQSIVPLDGGGDIISYPSLLLDDAVFALKLSPYIPRPGGKPTITAWTLLLDVNDGMPLALLDAKVLTTHRTAATTALAVDLLSAPDAATLSVVGSGPVARAHLSYLRAVRPFAKVRLHSRREVAEREPGVSYTTDIASAVDADVVALCTSAAEPVVDVTRLRAQALVTSVSTNAPGAHEVDPADLERLNVYRDFRPQADDVPEFRLAAASGWSRDAVLGDLPSLIVDGRSVDHDPERPTFFRSIGQGIEDAVIAQLVLQAMTDTTAAKEANS